MTPPPGQAAPDVQVLELLHHQFVEELVTAKVSLQVATWPPNPSAETLQVIGAVTPVKGHEKLAWKLPELVPVFGQTVSHHQTDHESMSPVAVASNVELPGLVIEPGENTAVQVGPPPVTVNEALQVLVVPPVSWTVRVHVVVAPGTKLPEPEHPGREPLPTPLEQEYGTEQSASPLLDQV